MNAQQNNTPASPVYHSEMTAQPKSKNPPVGFWTFIGLILLFSIPVIGLIAAIVFLCASNNKTIKNFSGATLALIITRFLLSLIIAAVMLSVAVGFILPAANRVLGTDFDDLSDLIEMSRALATENYSDTGKGLTTVLVNVFGEEYRAFFDELFSGKYERLLHQLEEEQYAQILSDFRNGMYPELTSKLNPAAYEFLLSELEKAAEHSPSLFDSLDRFLP